MTDLATLKRSRGYLKANLTRQDKFIQNFHSSESTQVPIRLAKTSDWWHEFECIQNDIEALDGSQEQLDEREQFYTSFFDIVGRLNALINPVSQRGGSSPGGGPSREITNSVGLKQEVKLPAMEIPHFYGSYKQWSEFYDTFSALVDSNTTLSDIQKFYYLKCALKGSAADVIHSLEVSSSNYKEAWILLKERYENKKLIALSHIESMYNFPNIIKECQADLRKFVDEIRKDLRALKTLGLGIEHWDSLLIYIFEMKLDSITRREWQKQGPVDTFASMDEFLKFLTNKCTILETSARKNNFSENSDRSKPNRSSLPHTTLKSYGAYKNPHCLCCKSHEHYIQSCKNFSDMSLQGKRNFVTKANLCWNCLRSGHRVQGCKSSGCSRCSGKHHLLLHSEQSTTSERQHEQNEGLGKQNVGRETTGGTSSVFNGYSSAPKKVEAQGKDNVPEVLLSTAIIKVQDQRGNLIECRALLDCGSQSSFMTKEFRDRLGLASKRVNISILGISSGTANITQSVKTTIYSIHSNYKVDSGFLIINKISNNIPSININTTRLDIPQDIILADVSFGKPGKIDVLLGASIFWDILEKHKISLGKGRPIIQKTKLGYVLAGPVGSGYEYNEEQTCNFVSTLSVQEQLEKFWILEEVGKERYLTREEEECEEFFLNTTKRDEEGRFVVKLPFRTGVPEVGNSVELATKRFKSMERKLERDKELKDSYHAFIQEYIDLGHMSKIDPSRDTPLDSHGPGIYYLPHHSVLKTTSVTTKLRVVFDASAATTNGISLNNKLMVGPKLQEDIFAILLRLRKHYVVITADVEKMYRQVRIADKDRDFQRILWRFKTSEPIDHYRLNTVTYGMASSGYLAVKCLQQLAVSTSTVDSEVADVILRDFYMDDLLTGAESVERAQALGSEVSNLLRAGGFVLRKWSSNKPEVIINQEDGQSIEHYIAGDNVTSKALGLRWNARLDTLHYDCPSNYNNSTNHKVTKRRILSLASQLFDPLGLISPLIVGVKLMLQVLWKERLGWDEEVSQEVLRTWLGLQSDFNKLGNLEIKRHAFCENPKDIQVHGFCDASQRAYGACIYVRSTDQEGNCYVNLLCSKSRVAPLKTISLPRLELCGALLLAKLVQSVIQSTDLKPSKIRYWSDSTIALSWIAGEPSSWSTFVANRTAEIQNLTHGHVWSHVSSEDNPADVLSRGTDCNNLKKNKLWWKGPSWLSRERGQWPSIQRIGDGVVPEQRVVRQVFAANISSGILERFSSFSRLHRSITYCLRFAHNCTVPKDLRKIGSLAVDELDRSWIEIIKLVQNEVFGEEIKWIKNDSEIFKASKIISLNPFLDSKGLLRVGGRLAKADLNYQQKFPVILPSKHRLTKLIILHEHYKQLHAGPQALLAQIRLKYWPVSGRQTIRSVLKHCIICFRARPRSMQQLMGDLPKSRITPGKPFATCGVDYAGPFSIKVNKIRGYVTTKAYLCIFVCFATKAVHLEMVSDLSTQSFLNCFKRFIARRGLCANIYSDNATNFTGANNELQELYTFLQDAKIQDTFSGYFSQSSIKWHFIPPRSPHFGGLWESAVKSAKYHLRRVLGEQRLTFEEIYTVVTQVESCLNSRPLTPLSELPDDLEALTPGHFLIGASPNALPQEDLNPYNPSRLQRYHLLTQLVQGFWKRWSTEYLGQLQQRHKWFERVDNIKIGDMVIVKDENLPPMKWQLGRVISLQPGADRKCRVVSIKTSSGVFKRAVTRLCLLPIETNIE